MSIEPFQRAKAAVLMRGAVRSVPSGMEGPSLEGNTMKPIRKSLSGLTKIELLAIVACVALLIAVILPALARAKARSSRLNCTNNMKQIGLAFKTWAIDNGDHYPMQVSVTNEGSMELVGTSTVSAHFRVMSNELSTPKILVCPCDVSRTSATNFEGGLSDDHISYFVGLGASDAIPSSLLSGDRNLVFGSTPGKGLVQLTTNQTVRWSSEIHNGRGNLLVGDGSVMQTTTPRLQELIRADALATNRLVFP